MRRQKLLALILAAALLLTGCVHLKSLGGMKNPLGISAARYEDMAYSRPDLGDLERTLDAVCRAAAGTDTEEIVDRVYDFYDVYDDFYTNYALANIRYSGDLSDFYWETEYGFCTQNSASVDAALEELYYALAASPCRAELEGEDYFGAGFFDEYRGENPWGAEFTAMLEQEAQLENQYYALAAQAAEGDFYENGGNEMVELLVELIALRQKMAAYWGYSSYVQYATDSYYQRDYTVSEVEAYLEEIQRELTPLYREVAQAAGWRAGYMPATEHKTFAYVEDAAQRMGGKVKTSFDRMKQGGLYDIGYGPRKYDASFETYLPKYQVPFVFMNPTGTVQDYLTFAHEFGHFCNDDASGGSGAGIDVLEVFSQGMEYLSLCYGTGGENLTWLKMADSLSLYVEQAAFASFEMQMYSLTGAELTAENLMALYDRVARAYGFDAVGFDSREFVTIHHYYTNPMYIIGYVVSNDAAMQLYQMEQREPGAGLRCFEENLDTESGYFLEFLEAAELESPFAPGRIQSVRKTFQSALKAGG